MLILLEQRIYFVKLLLVENLVTVSADNGFILDQFSTIGTLLHFLSNSVPGNLLWSLNFSSILWYAELPYEPT